MDRILKSLQNKNDFQNGNDTKDKTKTKTKITTLSLFLYAADGLNFWCKKKLISTFHKQSIYAYQSNNEAIQA